MKPLKSRLFTEKSWRRKVIDMINIYQRKSRAVSPVIATVLLIGLVVIAGVGVALVIFGTINTPAPIKVEVLSISEFATTDDDILIDQFSVTLQNEERTNVRIKPDGFELTFSNRTPIPGWNMDLSEILLQARTILTVPLTCDALNGRQLTPQNDTVYILVTVFPEGATTERSAKTFSSDLLIVGDTAGPFTLGLQVPTTNLGSTGLSMNFSASNNGSTTSGLFLEFSTDSPESIYFIINGTTRDRHYFSLARYTSTTFPDDTFIVNATSQATVDQTYLVLVFLWRESDLTILASAAVFLTFTG